MAISRRSAMGMLAAAMAPLPSAAAAAAEPEILRARIAAGSLPPMADRLPKVPRVIDLAAMGREPGRYGGTARLLIGGQRDIRLMTITGYARLVGYDQYLTLQPDVLES